MTGTVEQPARPADMPEPAAPEVAVAAMQVVPIGWTEFNPMVAHAKTGWRVDDDTTMDGGEALAEFAGRACYQSWTKPNPATATNAGYIRHILEVGHLSVLEHGTVTFYITGIARSCTHELIRHRHFSYSQLSQRYVPGHGDVVEPDVIAADPYLHRVFTESVAASQRAYTELAHGLERLLPDGSRESTGWRKQVRQAARSVLPNAAETRIVVTGNYRAWRHFIAMRATEHADVEIRALAVECLRHLKQLAPNVFGDFEVFDLEDGTQGAASPYTWES